MKSFTCAAFIEIMRWVIRDKLLGYTAVRAVQTLNLWTSFHRKMFHYSVPCLRLDTVYVSHTVDPIQTRLCTAAAISPSPESLLKYFEGSLLPLFMHTFLKTAGSSFSSHFYDAHNSALPLHGCPFSFSSETITFSFTQFNYFHCSETRAWGLACLLLFIHRQSFSRWHA